MKKLFAIVSLFFAAVIFMGAAFATYDRCPDRLETVIDYHDYADYLDLAEIINSEDLTAEYLENRNGKLIIEQVIGIVDNAETGDGHIFGRDGFSYISYRGVDGISDGNMICTYLIYNPDNNFVDDIIMRFDYIIDSKYEK